MIIRSLKYICLTACLVLISSCSRKVIMGAVESYEIATHQQGTMSVKSWVTGGTKNASFHAAQNTLEKLLFVGVPNTAVKRPLYKGERQTSPHKDYFDGLLARPFQYVTVGTYSASDRIKTSSGTKVGVVCTVQYKSLIRKLENDNVIKAMSEW